MNDIAKFEKDENRILVDQWSDFLLRKFDVYAASKYQLFLEQMRGINGRSILVVGSGSGEFAAYLASRGASVLCLDKDLASVELSLNTCRNMGMCVQRVVSRLEHYFPETVFDMVVATDVIEHIHDDFAAIKRMHALCKEGGKIVISVPCYQWLFGFHDEILGHYRRYSKSTLKNLVSPFFRLSFCRHYGFFLIPAALIMSKLLRVPYPVAKIGSTVASRSLVGFLIRAFFTLEKKIHFGAGVSLLLIGEKITH